MCGSCVHDGSTIYSILQTRLPSNPLVLVVASKFATPERGLDQQSVAAPVSHWDPGVDRSQMPDVLDATQAKLGAGRIVCAAFQTMLLQTVEQVRMMRLLLLLPRTVLLLAFFR